MITPVKPTTTPAASGSPVAGTYRGTTSAKTAVKLELAPSPFRLLSFTTTISLKCAGRRYKYTRLPAFNTSYPSTVGPRGNRIFTLSISLPRSYLKSKRLRRGTLTITGSFSHGGSATGTIAGTVGTVAGGRCTIPSQTWSARV